MAIDKRAKQKAKQIQANLFAKNDSAFMRFLKNYVSPTTTVLSKVAGLLDKAGMSIALGASNLVRIPMIWALGHKPSASKAAQFSLSALLTTLAISAFVIPSAAPVIGLTSAAILLVGGLFTLGRFFYNRHQLPKQIEKTTAKLLDLEKDMRETEEAILQLKEKQKHLLESQEENAISEQLEQLQESNAILAQRKSYLEQKVDYLVARQKNKNNALPMELADRGVGLLCASAALTGSALLFSFPPVGAAILLATSIASFGYWLGRLTQRFINWVAEPKKPTLVEAVMPIEVEDPNESTHTNSHMFIQQLTQKDTKAIQNESAPDNTEPVSIVVPAESLLPAEEPPNLESHVNSNKFSH